MKTFTVFQVMTLNDTYSEQENFSAWYGIEEVREKSWGRTLHPVMREDNQFKHVAFEDRETAERVASEYSNL